MKAKDPGRGRAISLIGEVYNGATEFMCRAWVTATNHLSLTEFLRALVRQLLVNDPAPAWATQGALSVLGETEAMEAEQLMVLVAQHLGERQYLVVVEDVCTRPMWDWIKLIFPDDKNASWIVVTSQRADVARHCADWPSRSFNLERVVDGLTAAEEWNQVKSCLWTEFGRNGSCVVIVTTTSAAVASHCSGTCSNFCVSLYVLLTF